jgi:hypothetical protein
MNRNDSTKNMHYVDQGGGWRHGLNVISSDIPLFGALSVGYIFSISVARRDIAFKQKAS